MIKDSHKSVHDISCADTSYREIQLTQGLVTLVDIDDYDFLNQFKWQASKRKDGAAFYASRCAWDKDLKRQKTVTMTRVIMGVTDSRVFVDHISGNTLDNRKVNLRTCTYAENCRNRSKQKNNSSGFKGVSFKRPTNRWVAQIMVNGNYIHLGYFFTLEEAAAKYNEAALKYHGEYARLNDLPRTNTHSNLTGAGRSTMAVSGSISSGRTQEQDNYPV
jgi:hypothetical protein